jgi:nucleotidyltransferase substrate binding protein (TIGR01987 family)
MVENLKEHEGITCASPKSCFREAKKVGILNDDEVMLALEMIDDRNLASHTYHEEAANKIFSRLQDYTGLMTKILERMK